jgi:hypothetical protein
MSSKIMYPVTTKTETHYILFKQSVGNIEIIFAHSNISKKKPPQISTTC